MHCMLCRNKVQDYARWRRVFESHADAHREAGLHLLYLLRDLSDPNLVVFLFRVDDVETARAFTQASGAQEAADSSGVIGETEIMFLTE